MRAACHDAQMKFVHQLKEQPQRIRWYQPLTRSVRTSPCCINEVQAASISKTPPAFNKGIALLQYQYPATVPQRSCNHERAARTYDAVLRGRMAFSLHKKAGAPYSSGIWASRFLFVRVRHGDALPLTRHVDLHLPVHTALQHPTPQRFHTIFISTAQPSEPARQVIVPLRTATAP
jgi:hypothetical protein